MRPEVLPLPAGLLGRAGAGRVSWLGSMGSTGCAGVEVPEVEDGVRAEVSEEPWVRGGRKVRPESGPQSPRGS